MPQHIAIILDGNGRWATAQGLPRTRGHEHGSRAVRTAVYGCVDRGVTTLTLYAFSASNWKRPKQEIEVLMRLAAEFAENELERLVEQNVKVTVIGDSDDLPGRTRKATERLVAATAGGTGMHLALALSYGGRRDMVSAIRQIAIRARTGQVIPEEVTEESLRKYLSTSDLPDPDLVIRTGGEHRLSDFLLFECAHAELFFSDTLWPDFSEATLDEAIAAYARRERRFGKTTDQVAVIAS